VAADPVGNAAAPRRGAGIIFTATKSAGATEYLLDLPDWVSAKNSFEQKPPKTRPAHEVLDALGEALLFDWPIFRPLFDVVEAKLKERVAS